MVDRPIPKAERSRAVADDCETAGAGKAPNVGAIPCRVAPIREVQDEEVAAGLENPRRLRDMRFRQLGPALHEIRKGVDGEDKIEGAVAEEGQIAP